MMTYPESPCAPVRPVIGPPPPAPAPVAAPPPPPPAPVPVAPGR
jgi:hypothetical protein